MGGGQLDAHSDSGQRVDQLGVCARVLALATLTGAERLSRGQCVCTRHACSQQRGEGVALRRSVHCQSLPGQDVHLRVLPGRGLGAPRLRRQGALSREAVGGQGALSQSGVGLSVHPR